MTDLAAVRPAHSTGSVQLGRTARVFRGGFHKLPRLRGKDGGGEEVGGRGEALPGVRCEGEVRPRPPREALGRALVRKPTPTPEPVFRRRHSR